MVQETKMTDIHIGVRLWSLTSLLFLILQTLFLLVYEFFYDALLFEISMFVSSTGQNGQVKYYHLVAVVCYP